MMNHFEDSAARLGQVASRRLARRQLQERDQLPRTWRVRSGPRRSRPGSCCTASDSPCRPAASTSWAATVEVDETFIGGKARNMHKARRKPGRSPGPAATDKTTVLGMIERGGEVRAEVIPDSSATRSNGHVRKHVEPGCDRLHRRAARPTAAWTPTSPMQTVDHAERVRGRARPHERHRELLGPKFASWLRWR